MNHELVLEEYGVDTDTAAWFLDLFREDYQNKCRRHDRRQSRASDILGWGRAYLPEHFTLPPSEMHLWLGERLDAVRATRGTKVNVIGPRGGAKSTIGTLAYVLQVAVAGREPYVWIVSDTRPQARSHLENIKTELTDNPRLAEDYPAAVGVGPRWRSGSIKLNNGVVIEAFGTGQRIRGRRNRAHRPTLIVCDDLQNDSHMASATQRENSRRWFHGTLMKAGTSQTNIVNLATALHREALALELHRTPGWTSQLFRAVERWPQNAALWSDWEKIYCNVDDTSSKADARAFYEENLDAMNEDSSVLWPAQEDLYTLMCMRVESGRTAFEREKQGSPIDPELCEWPEAYFDDSVWFDEWPDALPVKTLALDPSKGNDARRGDYSAFVMLGVDSVGVLYVEADLARRPTPQMVADGVALYKKFQPHAFGIEANQFQQLLAGEFETEFRKQGVLGATPYTIVNNVNKQVRIRRLGPYLSSRKVQFKADSPSTRLLVDQLRDFPTGAHDDGPDATEMALRLATELWAGGRADDGLGDRLKVG